MRRPFNLRRWSLALLAVALPLLPAAAQDVLTARFDTVTSRMVGPGMRYTAIRAPAAPWNIFVLEVDLTNPYLATEAAKSNDRRAAGNELTSSMARRKTVPGRRVVGAINAGFFAGGGVVLGVQINNGEVVGPMVEQNSDYSSVSMSATNRAMIRALTVTANVLIGSGSRAVNAYNAARATDALVVYNRLHGSATGTDASGTELVVRPLTAWALNDTVRAEVVERRVGSGNAPIAGGNVVLSGHGAAAAFLQSANVGDVVRIVQRTAPSLRQLTQTVSGYPVLLRSGVKHTLPISDHHRLRHPRTAMGVNRDTTKLWMVVVDGRTAASAGMTNYEQQDLFIRLGAYNAQGLDGGGSSTMVVNGAIVNTPSDGPGTERAVGDAFLVYSTAPTGSLARLNPTPLMARVFLRGTQTFSVSGADAFYAPVAIDPAQLRYELDPALGTITSGGVFTAGTRAGSGYLRIRYGTLVDSALVTVTTIGRVEQTPSVTLTDTTRQIPFQVKTVDVDGVQRFLLPGDVTWRVLDPSIGTVSATGVFQGRRAGTTGVVATAFGVSDTSTVTVAIGTGVRVLDPLDSPTGWRVVPATVDSAGTTLVQAPDAAASGGASLRLDYRFTETTTSVPVVRLVTDQAIYGVPDSVNLRIRSDGANHRLFLEFVDASGRDFLVSVPRYLNDATTYALMPGPMTRANIGLANVVFPVRLTGLRFELAYAGGRVAGKTYTGSFWIDDLRVSYPARATSAEPPGTLGGLVFLGARPNPAQGRTAVSVQTGAATTLRVTLHDVLGRQLAVVYDGPVAPGTTTFDVETGALPNGVYVLRTGDGAASQTLVVRR